MTTMNPYYAHPSDVGPVFDVAHFSRRKALNIAVVGLILGVMIGAASVYAWNPDLILSHPPKWYAKGHEQVKELVDKYPIGAKVGVGVGALVAGFCLVGGVSFLMNAIAGNFYVRVGEGGVSLRVPDGVFTTFERDLPWSDISKLKVVQEKQAGAMSVNSGNVGTVLELRTHSGLKKSLRLDQFRENGWIIYNRIDESRDMHPAALA